MEKPTMLRSTLLAMQLLLALQTTTAVAKEDLLVVSYGSHDAEPYAIEDQGELTGGIIKDVMDEIGKELDVKIEYVNVPRTRMDQFLLSGKTHVRVVSSPRWYERPERFLWSKPLFQESGQYVVSANNRFAITGYDDLKGKKLGTILGYQYPEGLTERFKNGDIARDDVGSLAVNFERLKLNRIDALLDADTLICYYLSQNEHRDEFIIAEKIESRHNIQAMISKRSPISFNRLDTAFQKLIDSGRIGDILNRYR